MGPIVGILASAGVAVGKEVLGGVVNKVFNNGTQAKASEVAQTFADFMKTNGVDKVPSVLAQFLGEEEVGGMEDLADLRKKLAMELLNSPGVRGELANVSGKEAMSLQLEAGGDFTLKTREGEVVRIEKGTQGHDLATKIHQMFSIHEMGKYAQGGSVYELANKVMEHPQLQASWSIRNDDGAMV